jgi:hypothetical protein
MTDVLLFQTNDGGDIEYINGELTMSAGLEQASYLSMFGGNFEDSGIEPNNSKQWWGNLDEPDPANRYRSQTQFLLKSLPATANNLRRIQDAVLRDHDWMVSSLGARVSALATIPALGRVAIKVNIELGDSEFTRTLVTNWGALT